MKTVVKAIVLTFDTNLLLKKCKKKKKKMQGNMI